MKKSIVVLVLALAIGILSYFLSFTCFSIKATPWDEVSWLKQEFNLTDGQYAEVKRLHEAFMPVCETHCSEYMKAKTTLAKLLKDSTTMTPEVENALNAVQQIEAECQRAFLKHGYEVAAVMSPEQGARYLRMIKEQINTSMPEAMAHQHHH